MICRSAIVLFALLTELTAVNAAEKLESASIRLRTLPLGQVLRVDTDDRTYHVQIVNGKTGEALVADSVDGKQFAEPVRMFILGATQGRQPDDGGLSLVIAGELKEGMRMEWSRDSADSPDRGVTSPVRAIKRLTPGHAEAN